MTCDASRAQRGAFRQQTNTCETGGIVLPGRAKQRKHESADVSFCDPVERTEHAKQKIYFFIAQSSRCIPGYTAGLFSPPAGNACLCGVLLSFLEEFQ